eukprot:CAMPEP_0172331386 /NCGR_PEP_ID=MMETSP1058-20130122/61899_1 /TAXON_ID=83371 /ORGANISM="Detonula confervacea, Strain CCMP 353" /LENGTH=44 /DNA_ID= /DNA_START= /DNA_END= /DNA_ORIENTATION=
MMPTTIANGVAACRHPRAIVLQLPTVRSEDAEPIEADVIPAAGS